MDHNFRTAFWANHNGAFEGTLFDVVRAKRLTLISHLPDRCERHHDGASGWIKYLLADNVICDPRHFLDADLLPPSRLECIPIGRPHAKTSRHILS